MYAIVYTVNHLDFVQAYLFSYYRLLEKIQNRVNLKRRTNNFIELIEFYAEPLRSQISKVETVEPQEAGQPVQWSHRTVRYGLQS